MIRIKTPGDLRDRINAKAPKVQPRGSPKELTWLERAEETREHNRKQGHFDRQTPEWSEIKEVYLEIQHGKCAFCERKLAARQPDGSWFGKVEWDIEHFRPKNAVVAWSAPGGGPAGSPGVALGGPAKPGYYLLAHDPLNYLASCKTCNTEFKKNYFPVAGNRNLLGEDTRQLTLAELPYLIYPLGDVDEDPEDLITFYAVSPMAKILATEKHRYLRALVTIQLLRSHEWELLLKERSEVLGELWLALDAVNDDRKDEDDRRDAQVRVDALTAADARHANCARAYKKLYEEDPSEAKEIYRWCTWRSKVDIGDPTEARRMELEREFGSSVAAALVAVARRIRVRFPWPFS